MFALLGFYAFAIGAIVGSFFDRNNSELDTPRDDRRTRPKQPRASVDDAAENVLVETEGAERLRDENIRRFRQVDLRGVMV